MRILLTILILLFTMTVFGQAEAMKLDSGGRIMGRSTRTIIMEKWYGAIGWISKDTLTINSPEPIRLIKLNGTVYEIRNWLVPVRTLRPPVVKPDTRP